MKFLNIIKKVTIIIMLTFISCVAFSNYSFALGDTFSASDNFLSKRKFCIKHN